MRAGIMGFLLAAGVAVGPALAQNVPLHFGTPNPVVDEFGQLLKGTDAGAAAFGHPVVTGDLIQILRVDAGHFAPTTNGAPHGSNPVLHEARVGRGVDPALGGPSGLAGGSIRGLDRGGSSTYRIIARAFNAPTMEEASFYADSQIYTVPVFGATSYGVFFPQLTATTNEIDSTDHDGDGLSRSWEKSYETDADDPDTDDDGMADGPEIRAGTDARDSGSLLLMVQLSPASATDLLLTWDTVAGKKYQIQSTTNDLAGNPPFVDVNSVVTATVAVSSTVVTNGLLDPLTHYRVRLVE